MPTPVDHQNKAVYGDWVQANNGHHLTGGIGDNRLCQVWCRDLAVLPFYQYNAPGEQVGRRFIRALAVELSVA